MSLNGFYREVGATLYPFDTTQDLIHYNLEPTNIEPLLFWKDNQHEFPVLASVARDILSIPATGAGVERLFNSARDICHYRRGSLKATTIQDLMMHMCTTRFDIEEGQLGLAKEFWSNEEIDLAEEEKDIPQDDPIALISDDVEDDSASTQYQVTIEKFSQRTLSKRRRSIVPSASDSEKGNMDVQERPSDGEDDDDGDIPLPPITQRRTSGRMPKRARRDEELFEYYDPR